MLVALRREIVKRESAPSSIEPVITTDPLALSVLLLKAEAETVEAVTYEDSSRWAAVMDVAVIVEEERVEEVTEPVVER
jgi:hypothetical protein